MHNLRCPVKDCSFSVPISEEAPQMEIGSAVNDLQIHLKEHTLGQLLQTIYVHAIHNLQHDIMKPVAPEKVKPTTTKLERETLCFLYNNVERPLSLALQPGTTQENILRLAVDARNKLRSMMRKMGWTGQF